MLTEKRPAEPIVSFGYERERSLRGKGRPVVTGCSVTLPSGENVYATACCHEDDRCVKSIGRRIALTRAIQHLPKDTRAQVWASYMKGRTKP